MCGAKVQPSVIAYKAATSACEWGLAARMSEGQEPVWGHPVRNVAGSSQGPAAKKRRDHTPLMAAPSARPSVGAALGLMRDDTAWAAAQVDFDDALLAPGGAERLASLLKTCSTLVADKMGEPLLPLTVEKLRTLGAAYLTQRRMAPL